ncbi:MAG: hypothetical protein GXP58_12180 [Deltaproteobacteria bacterium]|nr:hypothetical protein [Deltaproteobacteria bacterium]
MSFPVRWKITGTLTTDSPLHIGDGDTTERDALTKENENGKKEKIDISSVITDYEDRACIPGSTLKGDLRAWLKRRWANGKLDELLGSEDTKKKDAVGGKAEFHYAYIKDVKLTNPPPYWDAVRHTGAAASVAIDRVTRTASAKKLRHYEFVPPGVPFTVTITGSGLDEEEVGILLHALEGFNDPDDPVTLGASTGDGWGRLSWKLGKVRRATGEAVREWIKKENQADFPFAELGEDEIDELKPKAGSPAKPSIEKIVLDVTLTFDSPFLVNDPSRCPEKKDKEQESDETHPDHAPILDRNSRAYLPSRSFRGAFRSQAERILRTLGGDKAACHSDSDPCCRSLNYPEEVDRLCPACRLFGAAGWRSPLEVTDFVQAEEEASGFFQDFLAIDRFTGGGAHGAKFNALSVLEPRLTGKITVDCSRTEPWMRGLLALTLRDLIEGDITFGFGATKGYGASRAEITGDWWKAENPQVSEVVEQFRQKIAELQKEAVHG